MGKKKTDFKFRVQITQNKETPLILSNAGPHVQLPLDSHPSVATSEVCVWMRTGFKTLSVGLSSAASVTAWTGLDLNDHPAK